MAELVAADPRVRWFDNPKGPRHGELHRHAALQEARGEIVCYLCDDDLWLPDHVERMRALLDGHDFAYACPFWIDPQGEIRCYRVDLRLPYFRELFAAGENRIPLSCGAHTLDLYRRLPAGWRTTPDGHVHRPLHVAADPLRPGLPRRGRLRTDRAPLSEPRADRLELGGAARRARPLGGATRGVWLPRGAHRARARGHEPSMPRLSRWRPDGSRRETSALADQLTRTEAEYHHLAAWATGLEDDLRQLSSSVTWRLRAPTARHAGPERAAQSGCEGASRSSSAWSGGL